MIGEHGSHEKTAIHNEHDIEIFITKLRRHAARLPTLRERRQEQERARQAEHERLQAQWRAKEEQQRQWKEQQDRFEKVFADVEKWTKAERVRAYAAAFESRHRTGFGDIAVGSSTDGWLRWLDWYAEHLDPLTRPGGPTIGPDENKEP